MNYPGNEGRCLRLISKNNKFNQVLDLDWTSSKGIESIIRFLNKEKWLINSTSTNNKKLIHYFSERGVLTLVKYLVREDPDLILVKDKQGRTALFFASMNNKIEVVKYLINKGSDAFTKDRMKKSSQDYAKEKNYQEICNILDSKK